MLIVIAVIALVLFVIFKNMNKNANTNTSNSYVSSSTAKSVSNARPVDTLDKQHLYTCVSRFVGAVSTIRDRCSYRSWTQGGCLQIKRNEDGTYYINGHYDHDSNYDILNTLQKGGYLDYFGMEYVEDGFTYHIDGIDPNRDDVVSSVDDRLCINDNYIVSELKERFGTKINIKTAWTKDDSAFVSFNFPE